MSLDFIVDVEGFSFKQEELFSVKAQRLLSTEAFDKELVLQVIFLSDEDLLEMNKSFLAHDYYTDIITFPIEETEDYLEAELYISVDRVRDNAAVEKVDENNELLRVFLHGILHLVGYTDDTPSAKALMREKENLYIGA